MPVYELFALLRADLPREKIVDVLRKAGTTVLAGNGVLTDLKSYGEQPLAYRINSPAGFQYEVGWHALVGWLLYTPQPLQAAMFSMFFAANPAVLTKLNYDLRVDERVLRFKLFKQRSVPAYPSPYYIGKALRHGQQLNLARSPIVGSFPNFAYDFLQSKLRPSTRKTPGVYGAWAAEATKQLQGLKVPKPTPVLPPNWPSWEDQTSPQLTGPSFASGGMRGPSPFAPRGTTGSRCVQSLVIWVFHVNAVAGVRAIDDHTVIPV